MAISSVSSSDPMNPLNGVAAVSPPSTPTAKVVSSDATPGVSVDISKPGQLFSQLSSLASSDPDKFKAVSADIAAKLKDAAGGTSGKRADFLNQLADKFTAASQSGSAADLAPPRTHGHHGGHHHHGAGAGGGTGGGAPRPSGAHAASDGPDATFQTVESILSDALNGAAT